MNYNCIYFHLEKLRLGPIDAALQKLQYALKNSARANFFLFFLRWCEIELAASILGAFEH